ncbi:integral membrane protein 2B isoform X2 [Photinus pyralis]|nr:integral membrane protein 2B isoform X2 [Photinus pyralis]
MVIVPARMRRVSTTTTLCLLLTALIVVGIGIAGGTYLYQQYLRSQLRFKGWCTIPYPDGPKSAMFLGPNENAQMIDDDLMKIDSNLLETMGSYLQEEFELDLENQVYEKIDVPDFQNGRSGRFIHDFGTNTTSIVDVTGRRCFVMPLNRNVILPPRSLYDLIRKMWDGYYKINTEILRETMHVITPQLSKDEVKLLGGYITRECAGLPIYKLEKFVSGVVKRSAELGNDLKFTQFAGNQILEFDIVNMNELKQYEEGD